MKAILSNSIRKLLLFEITKMLAAVLKEFIYCNFWQLSFPTGQAERQQ